MIDFIIPPWVRIAALAVAIAAAGMAGWTVRGWKEDAARLDAERAAHVEYVKTVDGWAAALRVIDQQRAADRQQADDDRQTWERKLRDARKSGQQFVVCGHGLKPDGLADAGGPVQFDPAFVGLWDDALAIGLPQAFRAGGDHGTDTGADLPGPEDILANVAANGEQCNELRSRLLAAKEWARSIGAAP